MNNELHLNMGTYARLGTFFSGGELTLPKAGDFTVYIQEYQELIAKKQKINRVQEEEPGNPNIPEARERAKALDKKFETVNWIWNTVSDSRNLALTPNLLVKKGYSSDGKTFTFPKVLEGGGYCYVEAFFEGEQPVGKTPNGIFVRAMGTPKIIRTEWTDLAYNPIKDAKVAFGSQLLLHVYTEGLYGQEILIGLRDVHGFAEDLNIGNTNFFEREVKTYPTRAFENGQEGISGSLGKDDASNTKTSSIQKVVVEVSVDTAWMFSQKNDIFGNFGQTLEIKTAIYQKTSGDFLKAEENKALNVSLSNGKRYGKPQDTTNKPVMVGEIDTILKREELLNFTFGVFIDGTLNNMYNTEMKQKMDNLMDPRKPAPKMMNNWSNLSLEDMQGIYKKQGDPKYSDSSYENDLSNPAILFKNYTADFESVFKIYTEGIGSHSAPKAQGEDLRKEDYKKDDLFTGTGLGMGDAGIRDKVRKSIVDAVSQIKKAVRDGKNSAIGILTFDVFGFSRGAAAARHFVHVVTHPPYVAKRRGDFPKDLQGNDLPNHYLGKTMPEFGVLGQLLQEAALLSPETKVNVRFVGIYDTVPHHGLIQSNDIKDLGLDSVNKANYVVHMVAEDEYRANFDLVDISSVPKVPVSSGKKGGIELTYPGVHCDVGGAYSEGDASTCYKIASSSLKKDIEDEKKEFEKQGWYKEDEMKINVKDIMSTQTYFLEGSKKKVSNQYSYIPLHIMSACCLQREVPIDEDMLFKFFDFRDNWIPDNKIFLQKIKNILWNYSFEGGPPMQFIENGIINEDLRKLRYHYLHWNATYGTDENSFSTRMFDTNQPHYENGKRKRNVH